MNDLASLAAQAEEIARRVAGINNPVTIANLVKDLAKLVAGGLRKMETGA